MDLCLWIFFNELLWRRCETVPQPTKYCVQEEKKKLFLASPSFSLKEESVILIQYTFLSNSIFLYGPVAVHCVCLWDGLQKKSSVYTQHWICTLIIESSGGSATQHLKSVVRGGDSQRSKKGKGVFVCGPFTLLQTPPLINCWCKDILS